LLSALCSLLFALCSLPTHPLNQAQLAAMQMADTVQRLVDHNVVEIVLKLQQLEKVMLCGMSLN
jgi:hypothetical protein